MNTQIIILAILIIDLLAIGLLVLAKKAGKNKIINKEVKKSAKMDETIGLSRGWEREFTARKFRPEKYLVILVYLAVILFIGYILYGYLFPKAIPNAEDYVISARDMNFGNILSSFYMDTNILGDKEMINGKVARPISSSRNTNFVFKPKTQVSDNGEIEINLFNKDNLWSEVYLDDKLIVPDLGDYTLVLNSDFEQVYVKNSVLNNRNINDLKQDAAVEHFIYNNFPGASVYSFMPLISAVPRLDDYRQQDNTIDNTFRADVKLAVYAETFLDISFTKQDLNTYIGRDEYTVIVSDSNGKFYFNETYEDDGDRRNTNKLGKEQKFTINLKDLPRDIYFVSFIKDNENDAADSTIKNLKVNSNKFVIVGNILPWNKFEFYTKASSPKTLGFNYWQGGKNQTIIITGAETKRINLDKDWLSKTYTYNLTALGDYYIKSSVGYLWIYSDALTMNKETWFDLPVTMLINQKYNKQDVIVIDKTKLKIEGNKITYIEAVSLNADKETRFKFRVLDANRLYFESIKLEV